MPSETRWHCAQWVLSKGAEHDVGPPLCRPMQDEAEVLTSKTSNLAVLTLDHVFFSLATGLRFMPAAGNSR